MFVITGATGNTGSVAAETLLAAGKKVRVVVRNAAKAKALAEHGAEIFTADLSDEAALTRAFEGAEGVYLLSPPDLTLKDFLGERKKLTDSYARAVKAAGVKHVVLLSSMGAQHSAGTGIIRTAHAAEQALLTTGLPVTFVRAGYFTENWAMVLQPVQQDGVLPSFVAASQAIPMVASRDIGKAVAQALLDGPRGTRVIELGGPVDAKPSDVAAALSKIFDKPVNVAEAPLSAIVPTLTSFGCSQNVAELFREMYEGISNGKVTWQGSGTELQRGSTTIEQTLRALTGKQ
jgi:uncharacterized protein YbjT (DUF2867 family)